jgi:hypothetical protein
MLMRGKSYMREVTSTTSRNGSAMLMRGKSQICRTDLLAFLGVSDPDQI